MEVLELNFPAEVAALVRHKQEEDQNLLWDPCRKKWLVATPEEWVRQHAISYLHLLGYSSTFCRDHYGDIITFYK